MASQPHPHLAPPTLQVSSLTKSIERQLEEASAQLTARASGGASADDLAAADWLDVVERLKGARGMVMGGGPGGDL